ncbi:helix-turn-helix transcriptional regulator [Aestuariicella hydrocarbonica]|uniref:Helix-turn-helix transcriptional regulator n=1 Tax=Pseudomaricurvus hydrocarbonicus TaxID=1470433 RepID=A0A9E5JWW4_9GAMM|nr:helix-turn-helix domain-containing protein [Aestuariicella hydrocarbonica]NHO66400.1 helix-turn-helix transcriptional regulator [Aestuariicella hydrocarbonica]
MSSNTTVNHHASPGTPPARPPSSENAFGQLIRFWRNTLQLSQAQLAASVEAAPRHISFLETGRSKPTREMVLRLAQALTLGERNLGTLLLAAGFTHDPAPLDLTDAKNRALKDSLSMILAKHEPFPALVINPIGDIVLCNRAWLAMIRSTNSLEQFEQPAANLLDFYFSEAGLRQHIVNWEELACFLLLKIKEQHLLTGDSKLKELSTWLQAYPGLPENWAQRAKGARQVSFYDVYYKTPVNEEIFASRTMITGVEPERNASVGELQLHAFLPLNTATRQQWEGFAETDIPEHPLLYTRPQHF